MIFRRIFISALAFCRLSWAGAWDLVSEDIFRSHPEFAKHDTGVADRSLFLANPPLCDAAIVNRACQAMRSGLPNVTMQSVAIGDINSVTPNQIAHTISTDVASVMALLTKVRLANRGAIAEAVSVSCQVLCNELVARIPLSKKPPASDVGCYVHIDGGNPICDVDVSPTALQAVKFEDLPEERTMLGEIKEIINSLVPSDEDIEDYISGVPSMDDVSFNPSDIFWRNAQASMPTRNAERGNRSRSGKGYAAFENWARPAVRGTVVKHRLLNTFRIFPETETRLTANMSRPGSPGGRPWGDGRGGKGGRGGRGGRRLQLTEASIQAATLPRAVKGAAYVNQAITKMANGEVPDVVTEWFGNNAETPTREAIYKMLNDVAGKMSNLDFVYPGTVCSNPNLPPGVVGYVEPYGPAKTTSDGKYIVHLCDYYFSVTESEQVQTLVHEALHHETSFLKDNAYGTAACKAIAQTCQADGSNYDSENCISARTNADTVTFFISNAALGAQAFNMDTAAYNTDAGTTTIAAVIGGLVVCGLCTCVICGVFMFMMKGDARKTKSSVPHKNPEGDADPEEQPIAIDPSPSIDLSHVFQSPLPIASLTDVLPVPPQVQEALGLAQTAPVILDTTGDGRTNYIVHPPVDSNRTFRPLSTGPGSPVSIRPGSPVSMRPGSPISMRLGPPVYSQLPTSSSSTVKTTASIPSLFAVQDTAPALTMSTRLPQPMTL